MRPTVPIALGGAGGPVMDAPKALGIVYNPIETLAYGAAQTSRITLGTSVLDALFRSPIILACRLATLDRFSDGRLVVGVGQGGMEQEFQAAGVSMSGAAQGSRNTSWPCEPSGVRTGQLRGRSTASPRLTWARTGKAGRPPTDGGRRLNCRG